MASGNLISLFGAFKINGKLLSAVNNPVYLDIPPAQIVWVMNVTITDINGVSTAAFWIKSVNLQGLTSDDYFLPVSASLSNLAGFQSGLTAVSSTNKFTLYSNLIKSSDLPEGLVPSGTGVLINDAYTKGRDFIPDVVQTRVNVNLKNRLSVTQFWFSGDDTYAGQYEYFTSSGNA